MMAAHRTLLAACLLLVSGASPEAATLRWTGLGASPLWSDAANWDALRVHGNGDALLFGNATTRFDSVFDLTRTFASLAFAADAQAFSLHVQGSGATLAFDGVGLRNETAGSGPLRQNLYADAGTAGGSIVFSGHAGINLGDATGLRPVNLTARGGTSAASIGGHIVFQDDAATSASTYDQLRAEGARAVGGGSGDISFRGPALATRTASITLTGGTVLGALGAQASFGDLARAEAIVNVLAGEGGGAGARVDFSGRAAASVFASFLNQGASWTTAGADLSAQAITTFRDDATLAGSVNNEAGGGAGFQGGQLEFRDRARAGLATLVNEGAAAAGAGAGSTSFSGEASAEGASIVNAAGGVAGTVGGATRFSGTTVAGSAAIANNTSPGAGGGAGGFTLFSDDSNAQQARIDNQGGFLTGDNASTSFRDRASAGQAFITNFGGRAASALGGVTNFDGQATAGAATLVMAGGNVDRALGGFVVFYADTSAGTAVLDVHAASMLGATGGRALFFDRASASGAHITVAGSSIDNVPGSEGGAVTFAGASTAANASITVGGNGYAGGGVRTLGFTGNSTAAGATITLAPGQTRGGALSFEGLSVSELASAGSAHITNQGSSTGAARGLAIGGQTTFVAHSSAGGAAIANEAGFGFGLTNFFANSTAGDANLVNRGGASGEVTVHQGDVPGDAATAGQGAAALHEHLARSRGRTLRVGRHELAAAGVDPVADAGATAVGVGARQRQSRRGTMTARPALEVLLNGFARSP